MTKQIQFEIPFEVSGKRGETKEVSAGASSGGRLFLFHGYDVKGDDSAGGYGVYLEDIKINGRSQLRARGRGMIPAKELYAHFARGLRLDLLHPLHEATLVLSFAEDCTFKGFMFGTASDVSNDPKFAVLPPAAPCDARMPEAVLNPRVSKDDYREQASWVISTSRERLCKDCWHYLGEHPQWPWRDWSREIAVESIAPGGKTELVLETTRKLVVHRASLEERWLVNGNYSDAYKHLVAYDFVRRGSDDLFGKGTRFDNYHTLIVPADSGFIFRVGSATAAPKALSFKGKVHAYEFVAGGAA